MRFKKFTKDQRGHFDYWFYHVLAFNYVAIQLGVWNPKYLFHDFEKPWLMLLTGMNYKKVQKWHRQHNRHHLEYKGKREKDWKAMVIDWQCSRYTKLAHPLTAIEEANRKLHENEMKYDDYCKFIITARDFGLS